MTTLHTTFALLRESQACKDGYRSLAQTLGGVQSYGNETPINILTVLDQTVSEHPMYDTLFCLRATLEVGYEIKYAIARDFVCYYRGFDAINVDSLLNLIYYVWYEQNSHFNEKVISPEQVITAIEMCDQIPFRPIVTKRDLIDLLTTYCCYFTCLAAGKLNKTDTAPYIAILRKHLS